MGLGEAIKNGKIIDAAVEELSADHRPEAGRHEARKSIANFKLRAGAVDRRDGHAPRRPDVGVPRPARLDRAAARARLQGRVAEGVRRAGNYTLGVREQIIFPEIDYDKIEKIKGLNITVVTTARNDEEGRALLRHLGMPFRQ